MNLDSEKSLHCPGGTATKAIQGFGFSGLVIETGTVTSSGGEKGKEVIFFPGNYGTITK